MDIVDLLVGAGTVDFQEQLDPKESLDSLVTALQAFLESQDSLDVVDILDFLVQMEGQGPLEFLGIAGLVELQEQELVGLLDSQEKVVSQEFLASQEFQEVLLELLHL